MADEPKTPESGELGAGTKPEIKDTPQDKVYAGSFKTPEELEKAYKDLETKLGQQGEELGQLRKFQGEAYPIVDVVYGSEELMQQVRQAVDAKYTAPEDPKKKTNGDVPQGPDPEVLKQEAYLRQRAINDFKTRNGLDVLSPADYETVEKAMTDTMARWVVPGTKVPLEKVDGLLEDAYKLVTSEKLVEDRVLESLATRQTNQRATMSPISGQSPEGDGVDLTTEERAYAKKLGIKDEDLPKVLEYKKRHAEGNFESIIK